MVTREDDEDGGMTVTSVSDPVDGCSVQPQRPTESYDTGQQSRRSWRVFGPETLAALRSWDALDLELTPGTWTRTTITAPEHWPGSHVELTAELVEG